MLLFFHIHKIYSPTYTKAQGNNPPELPWRGSRLRAGIIIRACDEAEFLAYMRAFRFLGICLRYFQKGWVMIYCYYVVYGHERA